MEMDMDKMDDMVCFNQKPATGEHTDGEHAKNVEAEVHAHGGGELLNIDLSIQETTTGPTPPIR